jgi:hypothetical protein
MPDPMPDLGAGLPLQGPLDAKIRENWKTNGLE